MLQVITLLLHLTLKVNEEGRKNMSNLYARTCSRALPPVALMDLH